ncbi:MAG: adenosine kinase [Gammaproteobacteria bacterium]|nr:adenosine kinase [Gammaproteobacteria bacterium]
MSADWGGGRSPPIYDVYGVGNALVDMEYRVDDAFLARHGVAKGHMTLVEEAFLHRLQADLSERPHERMSGGSAANTVMAIQGFGGSALYSCKVASDEVGRHFLDDLADAGVATNANAGNSDGLTGRCIVLVTDDAERSMNTFLGVSRSLGTAEIDEAALADAGALYIEGYLSAQPLGLRAAVRTRELADGLAVPAAVSLSDPSMVRFFRDELERLLGDGVHWLFCNEEEALTWARTDRLDLAITELKDIGRACFITLGSRGSISVANGSRRELEGFKVQAKDTTGAGDIYAGACLHGLRIGMAEPQAARFGNYAAAALVRQYGARLRTTADYRQLLQGFKR